MRGSIATLYRNENDLLGQLHRQHSFPSLHLIPPCGHYRPFPRLFRHLDIPGLIRYRVSHHHLSSSSPYDVDNNVPSVRSPTLDTCL